MADSHHTLTAALSLDALERWSDHGDRDALTRDAVATMATASTRDWLMSDLAAHRRHLSLTALDWLASESEAKARLDEHCDSTGLWWFTSVLFRRDLPAVLQDLGAMLELARRRPGRFGADEADLRASEEWDASRAPADFELPERGGDGDSPLYVLCALRGFRRLVALAQAQDLCVLHLRYSYRARD